MCQRRTTATLCKTERSSCRAYRNLVGRVEILVSIIFCAPCSEFIYRLHCFCYLKISVTFYNISSVLFTRVYVFSYCYQYRRVMRNMVRGEMTTKEKSCFFLAECVYVSKKGLGINTTRQSITQHFIYIQN